MVEWLEGPHELPKWTVDDLRAIRDQYRQKLKELKIIAETLDAPDCCATIKPSTTQPEINMTYRTYEISIAGANDNLKFFEVVACDLSAAISDVKATYGDDVEIVACRVL